MVDKVKQKLLLTPEEQTKAGLMWHAELARGGKKSYNDFQNEAQLAKAIPLIRKAIEAERLDKPKLREALAELEHEQWWKWAKALTPELNDILYRLPEGSLEADRLAARLARWSSLFKPYAELTEEQKDQDRKWADKALALIPNNHLICKAKLALAKREERERIIAWGLEICPHWSGEQTKEVGVIKRDCSRCWQALEGESK